jgi:membrane peptidoglycan carboxypeptidase
VIRRLVEEGYISKAEGEEAGARPMAVLPWRRGASDFGA